MTYQEAIEKMRADHQDDLRLERGIEHQVKETGIGDGAGVLDHWTISSNQAASCLHPLVE